MAPATTMWTVPARSAPRPIRISSLSSALRGAAFAAARHAAREQSEESDVENSWEDDGGIHVQDALADEAVEMEGVVRGGVQARPQDRGGLKGPGSEKTGQEVDGVLAPGDFDEEEREEKESKESGGGSRKEAGEANVGAVASDGVQGSKIDDTKTIESISADKAVIGSAEGAAGDAEGVEPGAEVSGWSLTGYFRQLQAQGKEREGEGRDMAPAVAAVAALTAAIKRSEAQTIMELQKELQSACYQLKAQDRSCISLAAACDLFLTFVSRTSMETEADQLDAARARLIERGRTLTAISLNARATIAAVGCAFISPGSTVLTHGFSPLVIAVLTAAAHRNISFAVIATEGRLDNAGRRTAEALHPHGIPVTVVVDAALGLAVERSDAVLVAAEAVAESGGVMAPVGTFPLALAASASSRPVYVAAESFKFARMFPLDQSDWEQTMNDVPTRPHGATNSTDVTLKGTGHEGEKGEVQGKKEGASKKGKEVVVVCPRFDYTPPHLLSLLFTDLGVLTPAAVSDQLIQLYL